MKRLLFAVACLIGCTPLMASEQMVMAHRGASGYLPEHTLAAKAMAHAQGSHYLEQDVVLTKDDVPLVLHDIYLDTLTDVAEKFPERKRADGRYYAIDLTLAEIKQLTATERFNARTGEQVYPERFPMSGYSYQLHTLEEEIRFIQGLNHSTGREAGVFPEIKQTTFHEREGKDIVRIVFDLLQSYDLGTEGDDLTMIHSFEPTTLQRLRNELGWKGRLELAFGGGRSADGSDFDYLATPEGLRELAGYVDAVWAPANRMISWNENGELQVTDFVRDAKAAGLAVFGGVMVTENLPANSPSLDAWHDALFNVLDVDGVVTDYPDLTAEWLQRYAQRGTGVSGSTSAQAKVHPHGPSGWPVSHDGGRWDSGHVQGIAIDVEKREIYYSFTNLLARYDFQGRLLGTLVGWTGHLGDLTFNPADGKVYGSLEYKADEAFYIAVIDVAAIDRVGIEAAESDIMRTVHLQEVVDDYAADMDGDGQFDGNIADTDDHRYGSSGIDGVAFGPAFGSTDGPQYLTVGYGVYSNLNRSDNDHQVLLQYDVTDWGRYAQPLVEAAPHRSGPADLAGKYFVYTGNTTYGVQNIAYDADMERWFLGVYQGKKPDFPNYQLFAVEAATTPVMADLVGVPGSDGGWEQGALLALADDGLKDPATGIRGWNHKADMGIQALGNGLFYLSVNSRGPGWQGATLHLMRWTGDAQEPFVPVQ